VARRSRQGWQGLTDAYRNRIVRGLGGGDAAAAEQRYLAGASLAATRGKAAGEHSRRVERGIARGLTPTQAAGRPLPSEVAASAIEREFNGVPTRQGGGTAWVHLTVNAGQASQVGRYQNETRLLIQGRLPPAEFRRRWQGRRVAGYELEADPDRVVEAMRRHGPPPDGVRYRKGVTGAPP